MPVPHTYPISSNRSKAASLVFFLGLLAFFIYDFTMFILYNAPVINTYTDSTVLDKKYPLPSFAFGFFYGEDLDQILND